MHCVTVHCWFTWICTSNRGDLVARTIRYEVLTSNANFSPSEKIFSCPRPIRIILDESSKEEITITVLLRLLTKLHFELHLFSKDGSKGHFGFRHERAKKWIFIGDEQSIFLSRMEEDRLWQVVKLRIEQFNALRWWAGLQMSSVWDDCNAIPWFTRFLF